MKKIIVLLCIMLFLTMPFLSVMGMRNDYKIQNNTEQYSFHFSMPQQKMMNDHLSISLPETNSVKVHPQKPVLPIFKKTLIYPENHKIRSIDISISSIVQTNLLSNKFRLANDKMIPGSTAFYQQISELIQYKSQKNSDSYPSSWYEYSINHGSYQDRPSQIVNIVLYPVRINDNTLFYTSEFEVKINYHEYPSIDSINDMHLLVISPEEFTDQLEEFVDHKESKGIQTTLVSLESIYDSTYFPLEGRDHAEQVKYFIKNSYDQWDVNYVLLVGGRKPGFSESWFVPVRYVHVNWASENRYISDLYFADLYADNNSFSSWDTDENNIFSQWPANETLYDKIDLYPEICIGRWPCRNKFELDIMIQKTIQYENMQLQKKIVLVGGDTFDLPGLEGEIVCDKSLEYLPDFSSEKVYASETKLSGRNMRNALGDGAMFMHMHGHGSPIRWGTHYPDAFDERMEGISLGDVPWFFNDEYPILILGGCHTAMFNVSITNQPWIYGLKFSPEGLGWMFARKINGGGIATLGYTCFPVGSPGEFGDLNGDGINEPDCVESGYGFMQLELIKGYGVEQYDYLGKCWQYAVNSYIETFKIPYERYHIHTIEGFVLMGDPSLRIGGYA